MLVLLHGATLDHDAWAPQITALQDRFRVVAPDLRGHGESTGPFDFEAAVADTLDLLDHTASGPVVLVGLSLGANIAQEVVRRAPGRVRALVAADTTCNADPRHPFGAAVGVATLRAQAVLAGEGFTRAAAQATAATPPAQRYVTEVNAHRPSAETIQILSSLLTAAPRPDPDYRLPVPALLVHGELDRIGDIARGMRAWARREPQARLVTIPGAGHVCNLDAPEAFTAALLGFLDELPDVPDEPERPLEERAEELYLRYGASPWAQLPEATRAHYRELVTRASTAPGRPWSPRPAEPGPRRYGPQFCASSTPPGGSPACRPATA
jgi:pimeloyl-ACP methyl ester carboxylesterase